MSVKLVPAGIIFGGRLNWLVAVGVGSITGTGAGGGTVDMGAVGAGGGGGGATRAAVGAVGITGTGIGVEDLIAGDRLASPLPGRVDALVFGVTDEDLASFLVTTGDLTG